MIKKQNQIKKIMHKRIRSLIKIFCCISFFCCTPFQNVIAEDKLEVIGVDISSINSIINSGVTFFDENDNTQDVYKILADNGINHIRVRVWVNPYDDAGNGYGGGNCDLDNAVAIGKQAVKYGMKLFVDFHYSDFWADPSKQKAPQAWENFTLQQKQKLIYDYTRDSIQCLFDNGIDVSMVQVGNEINNGFCGETDWQKKCSLINSACMAVREFAGIMIVAHFTNPEKSGMLNYCAKMLAANGVDYDVFATSYYPFWHGTVITLKNVLKSIKKNFNKDVMVAETSYPFTLEDTDCFANTVNSGTSDLKYEVSVKGQSQALKDICKTLAEIEAIGVFYWEPAWISVGSEYESNKLKWEKYGSGWASSYATKYDPNDAGVYFGGSSWDNQALFDKNGKVLDSLKIFKEFIK